MYSKCNYVLKFWKVVASHKSLDKHFGSTVAQRYCLTRDRGAAGLSLTGVTTLCPWARHINPSLVLVQPRKTRPYITERLLMGCKESNQTKNQTGQTQIRLLLRKQSDLGFPCLLFWHAFCEFQPWYATYFWEQKEKLKCMKLFKEIRNGNCNFLLFLDPKYSKEPSKWYIFST